MDCGRPDHVKIYQSPALLKTSSGYEILRPFVLLEMTDCKEPLYPI